MCQHCRLVARQIQRIHDAQNGGNYASYNSTNERIKAEMQRIVDKIEAMAWTARIENEREYDLYYVHMEHPHGNRIFYTEADFDKWLADWANHNHSGGGGTVRIFAR